MKQKSIQKKIEHLLKECQLPELAEINCEKLASQFEISSRTLRRIWDYHESMTVHEYIHYIRMQKAAKILSLKPKIPISQVSEAVGFLDIKYFSRVFRKFAGMSTSQFRDL